MNFDLFEFYDTSVKIQRLEADERKFNYRYATR